MARQRKIPLPGSTITGADQARDRLEADSRAGLAAATRQNAESVLIRSAQPLIFLGHVVFAPHPAGSHPKLVYLRHF